MISKEIVISWFKGLSGDDRIDLMCLIVDYCLPSELRFIGTYLEASAQKDYHGFRTYESTANNPTDLTYMYLLEDPVIRRRLCLYIALLHSSNRQAAAVLFGILNEFHPSCLLDEEVLTELSLLYTLTANHPAFSFHQKHVLRSKLKLLRLQSVKTTSDLGETVSDCSTGSSTFLLDAESQSFSPVASPVSSNSSGLDTNEDEKLEEIEPVKTEEKNEEIPTIPENPPKVYVQEIKVLNIQKKGESKLRHESRKKEDYEYVIEVTWSDDTNDKIRRSYEDMFDFQCKLRKMYPNKVDENGQPWKLPFLPGRIRIFNKPEHKGERTPIPEISDYARLFASLPKFVLGCEHVLNFFHNHEKSKNRDKKSKSAKKEDKAKAKLDSLKNTKPNDTKPNETISIRNQENSSSGEKRVSDSTTKQTTDHSEPIIDKEKQKESDNNKEKLSQDKLGKSFKWSDATDHNANYITPSINGYGAPGDKRHDLDTPFSVVNNLEGKNGIIKMNTLQTSTLSVTTPVGPVLTTTPACNNNLYSIHSTILITSQNDQCFSNPGLHNSHSSLNISSSAVTANTFMPSRPFAVRPPISVPASSPVESPYVFPPHSHAFHRRSSTGSWSFRAPACSLTVQDWLKNLRLHKYSETFKGNTFNEILKLSDKDFEKLGMTIGARRKLRVNLEILRKRGCFSSDGLRVLDVLPLSNRDPSSPYHAPVISPPSPFNSNGYLCGGYCSDTDFVRGLSESDSASECGSDILSESYPQTKYNGFVPIKPPANGCRLSCYNCGSLGHVGGQCMAPNMEKRLNCSYRLKFDGVHSVL